MADAPVFVMVMLSVSPVSQALTVAVTRQPAPVGGGEVRLGLGEALLWLGDALLGLGWLALALALAVGLGPPPATTVRFHFWFAPPVQVHSCTVLPLAVAWPLTSRHSRDWTPTMVPSLDSIHFWLSAPVQSQTSTTAPAPVPRASRHLLPYTRSSPAVFGAKTCSAPVVQSRICAADPLVCEPFAMARHRLDWLPVNRYAGRPTVPAAASRSQEGYQLSMAVPDAVNVIGSHTGNDEFRSPEFHRSPTYT